MARVGAARCLLAGIGATACWGGSTTLTKLALASLDPLSLLVLQLAASLAFLGVIAALSPVRRPAFATTWGIAALGVFEPGLAYLFSLEGLSRISATEAVVLSSSEAFMIVLLSWVLLRERPRPVLVALCLVGSVGAAMISLNHAAHEGAAISGLGDALLLAGVLCAAVYVVLSGRWAIEADPTWVLLYQQAVALALVCLVRAVAGGPASGIGQAPAPTLLLGALSGIVQYGCAFWLYLYAMKGLATNVAGILLSLVPLFGVAVSVPVLGDRLTNSQWLGAAVVVAAMILLVMVRHGARTPDPLSVGAA